MASHDVLIDGFEGQDFAPAGGLRYKENAEQKAGKVEFQSKVTHNSAGALKLSVKPLCPPDPDACSERAEIWEKSALRVPYFQGVWYGFSVKFADPVPQDDHRYLIAQWKREIDPGAPGDFSPFLALRLKNGKLFATVETNHFPAAPCAEGVAPAWLRPDTNQMRVFVTASDGWTAEDGKLFNVCTNRLKVIDRGNKLPHPGSGWIDFAIYTKPGPHGDGHVEIFANNKWIVSVTGHIGHDDPPLGDNQYFKFGPYRAPHTTEWTLYYDNFRRSPRCADVLQGVPCPFEEAAHPDL